MQENFKIKHFTKRQSVGFLFFAMLACLVFSTSCNDDDNLVTHRNCDEVGTEITDLNYQVGSFISSSFSNIISLNYDEAAISIYVEDWTITSEEDGDCYTFIALPQLIEEIKIKSLSSMTFGGVEFNSEEELNGLFKIHSNEQIYSVTEFINIQNNEPLLFHEEKDEVVFQLLNKPDIAIDQSLTIQFLFNDSKVLNIEIPNFEVLN